MSNIENIIVSLVLGFATSILVVQAFVFLGSMLISISGFLKERVYKPRYLLVWIKSIAGIIACGIIFYIGLYIFTNKMGYNIDNIDKVLFFGVAALTLLGFFFHIARKIKRTMDVLSTPEFDDFHVKELSSQSVDDYVRKNLELLKTLQDGTKE